MAVTVNSLTQSLVITANLAVISNRGDRGVAAITTKQPLPLPPEGPGSDSELREWARDLISILSDRLGTSD